MIIRPPGVSHGLVEPPGRSGLPLAVVVAMKPQLRGRIRRNVETLLDLGMEVVVVTVRTRKELFVGLEHPHLSAHLLEARSAYTRFAVWAARDARRREVVRVLRLDCARRAHVRRAWRLRTRPGEVLRHLWDQPSYGVPGGRRVTPFPRWVMAATIAAAFVPLLLLAGVLGTWHTVVRAFGGGPRAARGLRSVERAVLRVARRPLRTGARALRRRVWVPLRRSAWSARAWGVDTARRVLLATNRLHRFLVFWRESTDVAVRYRPDLLVSSDLPGLVGAARAARRVGVRQVHDCHELYLESTDLPWYERRVLWPVEKRYMRRAARVIAVNRSIADEYRSRYGVRAHVVRNCADLPERVEPRDLRELASLPADSDVVLYQGGFSDGRGLDVCVRAMVHVPPTAHLVMLGYGPLAPRLVEMAAELGVADRVHVIGAVPPDQLLGVTASASVGLIPYQPVSRNNYYSLPNKIFEYTSVGVPVVASDLPELRRIAVDEGCGVVYDPYDPASLARAVTAVLDPARRAEFRLSADAFGRANSWERERQVLVRAVHDLVPRLLAPGVPAQRPSVPAPADASDAARRLSGSPR